MKTPIKDPNSFFCSQTIKEIVPPNSKIKSLLLFSGQLEFSLAFSGHDVNIATNKYVIYEFWNCALRDPYLIAKMAESLHSDIDSAQLVYVFQNEWPKFKDPYFRSALFYLLNHYSLKGTVSHGEFNADNYSALSGRSLINFFENHDIDKLKIKYYNNENWEDALEFVEQDEILFLPIGKLSLSPLNNSTFDGHEQYNINNRKVKQLIENYNKKFIMVYKSHPSIFKQYRNFNLLMVNKHGSLTNEKSRAEDIIVTNMDIK